MRIHWQLTMRSQTPHEKYLLQFDLFITNPTLVQPTSQAPQYQTTIFDPNTSFSGNGPYVEATTEQNPQNITGHTGGGYVSNGSFVP